MLEVKTANAILPRIMHRDRVKKIQQMDLQLSTCINLIDLELSSEIKIVRKHKFIRYQIRFMLCNRLQINMILMKWNRG